MGTYYANREFIIQYLKLLDISRKECRAENPYPWKVSTRVLGNAYLMFGDVYLNKWTKLITQNLG
ncbi:hypothetical protein DSM107003_40460 [Trichormus variabilis SAG 1403-4b]|uniref:Uncharacterized protein n=1 Tax=Trichormus variabilis SAG 1403-4b TaxID=447716 RepID=A0A433UIY9_ANAVA|nr:hypothetical protein DSM107003_40460 [Trichormus variabilis SAG 1403-4b]